MPVISIASIASASSTFSNYPISSGYKDPDLMTTAGGAMWYVESTNTVSKGYIAKVNTSGTVTDYAIGYPAGTSSFEIQRITTGPDDNVWFYGRSANSIYVGYLDTSTGGVTFYGPGPISVYTAGFPIVTGPDGNIYYAVKDASSSRTYLLRFDPSSGTTTTAHKFDTYSIINGMTAGPDGRLWVTDGYYGRVYAFTLSSTPATMSSWFQVSPYTSQIVAGPDGNVWYIASGALGKITMNNVKTEYALNSDVRPKQLVAGSDGAVWFVETQHPTYNPTPSVGRITTNGTITEYAIPGTSVNPYTSIALGPDDALWFTYRSGTGPAYAYNVGRVVVTPTFSNYPISSGYKDPDLMTTAGGAMWYVESTNTVSKGYIAKVNTSGTVTDYAIGNPSGQTSFTLVDITTGPDGNVWFYGRSVNSVYAGYLNVSTGAVTFYGAGPISVYSSGLGPMSAGSDGNLYYTVKTSGAPANTYLVRVDPSTGLSTTVYTFDTYSFISGITAGPDDRLWVSDTYYGRIYAFTLSSGGATKSSWFSTSPYVSQIIAGPDDNIWYRASGVLGKITMGGTMTEYALSSDIRPRELIAGSDGAVWFVEFYHPTYNPTPSVGRITTNGTITEYTIPGSQVEPYASIALGPDDAIWFTYRSGTGPAYAYNVGRLSY